jgi:FSR family fosmidomycin resistance protein-like MFS transporter
VSIESVGIGEAAAVQPERTVRQDVKILTLISTGHFMSHFYFMALPPLFPFFKAAFGVSYTELGVLMSLIYSTAAITQLPVGFMVDRLGARIILTFGLVMMACGVGLMGLAPSYWTLVALGMLAATGNSVFHPCDYAILNSSISERRMGRAFSAHNFSGQLGTGVAPAAMIFLAHSFGWRAALIIAGAFGLVVMLALTTQWNALHDDAMPKRKTKGARSSALAELRLGMRVLFSKEMAIFFLFFAMLSMTTSGMQSFSVAALVDLHGTPLATASAALTGYLLCSAFGVLVGGELADRTKRHDIVAGIVFIVTAIVTTAIAMVDVGAAVLMVLMLIMGFGQGLIRPARDMMLRQAAPKGSTGKIFAYVSAGISGGSALAPIPFGYLLDHGRPDWVFYLLAIFMLVSLVTVAVPKKQIAPS